MSRKPSVEIDPINQADATNRMTCCKSGGSEVELIFEPDPSDQGEPCQVTSLACYAGMRVLTFEQRRSLAYIEALRLILNEEVDAQILQNALNALDDYKSEGEGNILSRINNGNLGILGHK